MHDNGEANVNANKWFLILLFSSLNILPRNEPRPKEAGILWISIAINIMTPKFS